MPGCAANVEDLMVSQITGPAFITLGSVIFNLYAMLLSCCMWWKRKAVDVFPDDGALLARKLGNINWQDVKDQFEVKPQHNVLVKKGFLPETDKARLKYQAQQDAQMLDMHMSVRGAGEAGEHKEDEGPLGPEGEGASAAAAPDGGEKLSAESVPA